MNTRASSIFCEATCWLVAVILAIAAAAKAISPMTFLAGVYSVLDLYLPIWMVGLVIVIEFGLAAWLVSGKANTGALKAASFLFLMFSVYHIYNIATGRSRPCGCMGTLWLQTFNGQMKTMVEASFAFVPSFLLVNAFFLKRAENNLNLSERKK